MAMGAAIDLVTMRNSERLGRTFALVDYATSAIAYAVGCIVTVIVLLIFRRDMLRRQAVIIGYIARPPD
jgi:hypothetical protein